MTIVVYIADFVIISVTCTAAPIVIVVVVAIVMHPLSAFCLSLVVIVFDYCCC